MKIDGNTPISLNLNLESVHAILTALGSQPYDKVAGTVAMIQEQSAEQIRAAQANNIELSKKENAPA